jgi:hypothetical protein
MKVIRKAVGTQNETLGEFDFPVLENIEEAIEAFGDRQTLMLLQRAVGIDVERIARDTMKSGKTLAEAQAAVDAYKPGLRGSGKPTVKIFLALLNKFGKAKHIDEMLKAQEINETDGVEAAVGYLRSKEAEL